ncbi:hypothetical protein K439DRAFT_1623918 [Ramaria rubella]|nr:hypothetical protein K439DRAFT_1623918 [Ramaria rubella]
MTSLSSPGAGIYYDRACNLKIAVLFAIGLLQASPVLLSVECRSTTKRALGITFNYKSSEYHVESQPPFCGMAHEAPSPQKLYLFSHVCTCHISEFVYETPISPMRADSGYLGSCPSEQWVLLNREGENQITDGSKAVRGPIGHVVQWNLYPAFRIMKTGEGKIMGDLTLLPWRLFGRCDSERILKASGRGNSRASELFVNPKMLRPITPFGLRSTGSFIERI